MQDLFSIRGQVSGRTRFLLEFFGILSLLVLWFAITGIDLIPKSILPTPVSVLKSLPEIVAKDSLVSNLAYSFKLNILGYLEAIAICLPLGFIVGLFPIFRDSLRKPIDALRFVPLTATTGLFLAAFGIYDLMKVQFLAFGIMVYLLPVVVQRIWDVDDVYQQTAFTLGATKWQMIRKVFFPAVISKLFDDIRVLVAISWTYIIVAEMLNKTGGVGAMAYTFARQSRVDKIFALLAVIIIVGFLQDLIFKMLDKFLFTHKYTGKH